LLETIFILFERIIW